VRGGRHTAVLTVRAEVCERCGERLYSKETISRFEQIRSAPSWRGRKWKNFSRWGYPFKPRLCDLVSSVRSTREEGIVKNNRASETGYDENL